MVQLYPITLALVAITAVATQTSLASAKKLHYIHWNKYNPMFRLDNTDHIVDINSGNLPWEYDQVNIICPTSKPGTKFPERHVIYSVTRDEFDSCRITNPKPKIVAICNNPYRQMYFTITFRSFTPTPGGLEFRPGQDYYFISTSSREDLHRRVGGGCGTHNMKMIFKVADNHGNVEQHYASDDDINQENNEILNGLAGGGADSTTVAQEDNSIDDRRLLPTFAATNQRVVVEPSVTEQPITYRYNSKVPSLRREIYYYHPKDLMERQQDNDIFGDELSQSFDNQIWRQKKSMRLTSGGSNTVVSKSRLSTTLMTLIPFLMAAVVFI